MSLGELRSSRSITKGGALSCTPGVGVVSDPVTGRALRGLGALEALRLAERDGAMVDIGAVMRRSSATTSRRLRRSTSPPVSTRVGSQAPGCRSMRLVRDTVIVTASCNFGRRTRAHRAPQRQLSSERPRSPSPT